MPVAVPPPGGARKRVVQAVLTEDSSINNVSVVVRFTNKIILDAPDGMCWDQERFLVKLLRAHDGCLGTGRR